MGKNKRPAVAKDPPQFGKQPRIERNPDGPNDWKPVWRFQRMDMDGPWSWAKASARDLLEHLHERLRSFESMTWNEIDRAKSCGSIAVAQLCKEARDRLMEIRQDDVDHLYKLRITQKGRVWSIRDGHIFLLLWWDPDHTVYPMNITDN